MTEQADEIIIKMQCVLDNYFSYLGNFAFDKGKEYLEKERDSVVKSHAVAPFFSSAMSAFSQLAAAEKSYANFMFLSPKGFLRKDSSLKSVYESLLSEYQRLEEKHYVTPVQTPTMSPSGSTKTPPIASAVSPSAESEASTASIASTSGTVASVRGGTQSYLGEDILENLASHLCGQLLCFIRARLKMMEFYEKVLAMSSTKFMRVDVLLNNLSEIVKSSAKLFHHPMLSPIKSSFSFECEILLKLLEAEVNMQNWRFLPSLLCLHDAHSKLGAWISMPKEIKKVSSSSTFKMPPLPPLYNWLRTLKCALISKFTLYFSEILSKQTNQNDMKAFCAKASIDYIPRIIAFQKRYDVACVAIVLDTNGLDDYRGHGYISPDRHHEAPKGMDSFPPIVTYPLNCFTQEKHMSHWPSVLMIMNKQETEIKNTDTAFSFYDTRMTATYFMSKIESRMTLVFIFESKKTDKDTHIHRFMQTLCSQLRGNKIFASIKPGSK